MEKQLRKSEIIGATIVITLLLGFTIATIYYELMPKYVAYERDKQIRENTEKILGVDIRDDDWKEFNRKEGPMGSKDSPQSKMLRKWKKQHDESKE